MKKFILLFAFVGTVCVTLTSNRDGGIPYTGIDGAGARGGGGCSCHNLSSDPDIVLNVELDSNGQSVTHYVPEQNYQIKIKGRNNTSVPLPKFGFRTSAVAATGAETEDVVVCGMMQAPPNCKSRQVGNYSFVGHKEPIPATSSTANSAFGTTYEITIPWQAPSAGKGTVNLYAVLLAANDDHLQGGDKWNKIKIAIEEFGVDNVITGKSNLCVGTNTTLKFPKKGGTWSCNNADIANIDANTGKVTGKKQGSVRIEYTYKADEYNTATAEFILNVVTKPDVPMIMGYESVCDGGQTITLSNAMEGGKWIAGSTSNPSRYFSINQDGIVKGLKSGSDFVWYQVPSECAGPIPYAKKKITVNPAPNPGAITSDQTDICIGDQVKLNIFATGGIWIESNGKASVSPDGLVTPLKEGNDTIFYKVKAKNGCESRAQKVFAFYPKTLIGGIIGAPRIKLGVPFPFSAKVPNGTWSVDQNASITSNGLITGTSEGDCIVTYSVNNGNCVSTDTYKVRIEEKNR